MATTQVEVLVPGDGADPFRYGWRDIARQDADGSVVWERAPLTLLDVLHPQEGDYGVQSDAHTRRCAYLYDVIRARLAGDPTAVVLHDTLVDWGVPGLRPHAPDIAVFFGVRELKDWGIFDLRAEGARPALVIEVTSPHTATLDRSNKLEEYDVAGVPLYVIVDSVRRADRPELRLRGHELGPTGYGALATDARGQLWLAPVRLWLGLRDGEVACFDAEGRRLGDYQAVAAALEVAEERAATAEERASAEAEARAALAARLREAEEELRRLRGQ
jgi:hypothetical protein